MAQFACHAAGGDSDERAGEAVESAEGTGDAEAVTGRSLLTNVRSDRQRWRQAFLYKYKADNAERMASTSRTALVQQEATSGRRRLWRRSGE